MLCVLLALNCWFIPDDVVDSSPEIVVIVHPDHPSDQIDDWDLERIFLNRLKVWPNLEPITPVMVKAPKLHHRFLAQFVSIEPNAFENYWKRLIFSGKGKPPQELESAQEVIDFVRQNPGSIGYVFRTQVTDQIKMLEVVYQ